MQSFNSVRHKWTPAYSETYYRSQTDGLYKKSGLLIIKERKCITKDDVFVSEITVINDNNEPAEIDIKLLSTQEKINDGLYDNAFLPEYINERGDISVIPDVEKYKIVEENEYRFSDFFWA